MPVGLNGRRLLGFVCNLQVSIAGMKKLPGIMIGSIAVFQYVFFS